MKHYWYLVLEYKPPSKDPLAPDKILKEFCVPEEAYRHIVAVNTLPYMNVYTLPSHPYSGCLDTKNQCADLSLGSKIFFIVCGVSLLVIGIWSGFYLQAYDLFSGPGYWKFWVMVIAHCVTFGLAFWGCNFVNRNRVEELLYETPPINLIEKGNMAGGKDYLVRIPGQKTQPANDTGPENTAEMGPSVAIDYAMME